MLIRDPKILLMDEPFGPLDAQTRQIMGNLLLELWAGDRKAVLFVTHDLEEAIALADRVVIMSAGPQARIIGDHAIDLGRPRDAAEVRLLPRFHELHKAIWGQLRAEVMKAYGEEAGMNARPRSLCSSAGAGGRGRHRHLACRLDRADRRHLPAAQVLLLHAQRRGAARLEDVRRRHGQDRQLHRADRFHARCSPSPTPCFGKTVWQHLLITLTEGVLAFAIGAAAGIVFGFWLARHPLLSAVFDPYIKMLNALPRVVLAPIFLLWLGLGIWSKVALGVTLVFFIVFFNVYQGVKEVSPAVLANARMLGMNERQLFRHVYWPSALSWMFSSLHTSVGFAIIGAVVGEYLGSAAGLGYMIQQAEGTFDTTGVFAGMVILAVFVLVIDWCVTLVERRLLVWRPPSAAGQG